MRYLRISFRDTRKMLRSMFCRQLEWERVYDLQFIWECVLFSYFKIKRVISIRSLRVERRPLILWRYCLETLKCVASLTIEDRTFSTFSLAMCFSEIWNSEIYTLCVIKSYDVLCVIMGGGNHKKIPLNHSTPSLSGIL